MDKAKILRGLLNGDEVFRLVGSHNALGAKIVESCGFEGIWASGFEISTSFGLPDASILSMKHFLDACSAINDATKLPVVLDGDSGYGGINNVIFLVKQLEKHNISGVVIEDKAFPKLNSYIGNKQKLISINEFANKIMAAKDHAEKDLVVIARTETFISGGSIDEALKRANSYVDAGADAIFIHSKLDNPSQVIDFVQNFSKDVPVIVCPTSYPSFNLEQIKKYPKIRGVIYANHGVRSQIKAMKLMLSELNMHNDLTKIEKHICTMQEAFELQGMYSLKEREKK